MNVRWPVAVFLWMLTSVVGSITTDSATYAWNTNLCGTCSLKPGFCGEGLRKCDVWCQSLEEKDKVVSEDLCLSSLKPPTEIPCFRDCDKIKPFLRWYVTDWSTCNSDNDSSIGIARRNVTCYLFSTSDGTDESVDDGACEQFEEKPATQQNCSGYKSRDCVTTDMVVSWPGCQNCTDIRVPRVLVAPSYGGEHCKATFYVQCDFETCRKNSSHQDILVAEVGAWGDCLPVESNRRSKVLIRQPHVQSPVIGTRTRSLTCLNNSAVVDNSKCWRSGIPPREEPCVVPLDCGVSPWSVWSLSEDGCISSKGNVTPEIQVRHRKVLHIPQGQGSPCPVMIEKKTVRRNLTSCEKRSYQWIVTEWGKCLSLSSDHKCGGGVRHRKAVCVRLKDLFPVLGKLCKEQYPETLEECYIPCREPCKVSDWSSWSSCIPFEYKTHFEYIEFGYSERFRHVLDGLEGEDCPHLHEVADCTDDGRKWKYTEWSRCRAADNETNCGKGEKTRSSFCVLYDGTVVSNAYCELYVGEPFEVESCYVPCPSDCILSEWSSWTMCNHPCHDTKLSSRMSNRRVLAYPTKGGNKCDELVMEDDCLTGECLGMGWEVGPWQKCLTTEGTECGTGIQKRDVICRDGQKKRLKVSRCQFIPKPQEIRNCSLQCPVNCNATKFSEWTSCPKTCDKVTNQTRKRVVIQEAKDGGEDCLIRTEVRNCLEADSTVCKEDEMTSHWVEERWSKCILSANQSCGRGVQVRDVTCVRRDGKPVEPWHCLSDERIHHLPEQFRDCYVDCAGSCSYWDLESWKACGNKCPSYLPISSPSWIRDFCEVKKEPFNRRDGVCRLLENFERGEWSECVIDNSLSTVVNGLVLYGYCGTGLKYRLRPNTGVSNVCPEPVLESELCTIPCPQDCKMSAWTEWSALTTRCGPGYKTRSRKVLIWANEHGRPCPHSALEEQVDVSSVKCDKYVWSTTMWSNCKLTSSSSLKCGYGNQRRNVSCVETKNGFVVKNVPDEMCESVFKPDRVQDCRIFCPGECVVSDWSEWDECPKPCNKSNIVRRKRFVLRSDDNSSTSCPALEDSRECIENLHCFDVKWVRGAWASCILPQGASCGSGRQRRTFMCQRSDGIAIDPVLCQKHLPLETFETERNCSVVCPIDCVVSSWSKWNTSSCKSCNFTGYRTRTRMVELQPSTSGRPCPVLEQRTPCERSLCFTWDIGEWSTCDLQGGTCGSGIRRRQVKCLDYKGLEVDAVHCLTFNISDLHDGWLDSRWLETIVDVKREETCLVPCQKDSLWSDWSKWSHCERSCEEGELVGYQTRSRVLFGDSKGDSLIEKDFYQTRPCLGGSCLTFEWKIVDGDFVCTRTDGLIVHGGCKDRARPCTKACPSNRSFCDASTGKCQCKPGYFPVYSDSQSADRDHHVQSQHASWIVRCETSPEMDSGQNANVTVGYVAKYFPEDSETSFWFYAMISVGTAFIIFVIVTVYLMCGSK